MPPVMSLLPRRASQPSQPSHPETPTQPIDMVAPRGQARPGASPKPWAQAPSPAAPGPGVWGSTPEVRLLCELVRQGGQQRAETRLRKSYEDAQHPKRRRGVVELADAVARLRSSCPHGLPQLLCALGKNADIERVAQVSAALGLAAELRYLPLWRALAQHNDFTRSHGPHFADHPFAAVLAALPRLDAALSSARPRDRLAALHPITEAVQRATSGEAARQALAQGLQRLEKGAVYRLFIGAPGARATPEEMNASIDDAVIEDPRCRADLHLLTQRCGGRNNLQKTTHVLMELLRPAIQRFCAPGSASIAERRAALQAELNAHPQVRREAEALRALGFNLPVDGMLRTYSVPVRGSSRHVPVSVQVVQDLFGAARCCESDALGGCYAATSMLRSSKPLENGISPASRFISVRDEHGRELETVEAGLTQQGLWLDRFEGDHALDLSALWGDFLAELVRSGAVPQAVVRQVPAPRANKSPWFDALAEAHPTWRHTGARTPLQRINQVFSNTYYDSQWDDGVADTHVDARCLVITPAKVRA